LYTIDNTKRWSISRIRTLAKARGRIWDTREWADKAGGYAIQGYVGARFVKSIRGDYYNVVGLPISRVYQELKKLGVI
jgi:septum formation protein